MLTKYAQKTLFLCKMFIIQHFLINFVIKCDPCIGYDPGSNSCVLCNFNYYDQNYINRIYNLNDSILNYNDCQSVNEQSMNRTILVSNISNLFLSNGIFDFIYADIVSAFINETYISSKFHINNTIIYLAQEIYYIYKFQYNNFNVFRRVNTNFTIKPLLCSQIQINSCFVDPTIQITIIFKSFDFMIFVSRQFNIFNIIFEGKDSVMGNISKGCLENTEDCCKESEFSTIDYSNCGLERLSIINESSNLNGLFMIEDIFDKTYRSGSSYLTLQNCIFKNVFFIKENPSVLINIEFFGGSIYMKNTILYNCFFRKSIIFYTSQNTFIDYSSIMFENYQLSQNNSIILENIIISSYNNYKITDLNIMDDNSMFSLLNFEGSIQITNLSIDTTYSSKSNSFLFFFLNINVQLIIFISDSTFCNMTGLQFIYSFSTSLTLKNVKITDYFFLLNGIVLINSENLYQFINVTFDNIYSINKNEQNIFLESINNIFFINSCQFSNFLNFTMQVLNGNFSMNNTSFNNIFFTMLPLFNFSGITPLIITKSSFESIMGLNNLF